MEKSIPKRHQTIHVFSFQITIENHSGQCIKTCSRDMHFIWSLHENNFKDNLYFFGSKSYFREYLPILFSTTVYTYLNWNQTPKFSLLPSGPHVQLSMLVFIVSLMSKLNMETIDGQHLHSKEEVMDQCGLLHLDLAHRQAMFKITTPRPKTTIILTVVVIIILEGN